MGRAPCCDKSKVKRGPWSQEEDAILKTYIDQNGTGGNWIALPQKIGLRRCGKSCRLRWLNYLRPNIKHGDFSEEEDRRICELFVSIGSRWSVIAAQLPGRTDNDIKNYWNTKLKKRLLGPTQSRNTLLVNQGILHSETNLMNSNAIDRMQLQLQFQGLVQSPFSFYNNPALWPNTHPLGKLNNVNCNDVVISPNIEQPMIGNSIQDDGSLNMKYNDLIELSNYQGIDEIITGGKDMNTNMNWWDFNGFEVKSSSSSGVFQESSTSADVNGFNQEYVLGYDMLA